MKLHSCLSSAYILPVISAWKCCLYTLSFFSLSVCLSVPACNPAMLNFVLQPPPSPAPLPLTVAESVWGRIVSFPIRIHGALHLPPLCLGSLFWPLGGQSNACGDPALGPAISPFSNFPPARMLRTTLVRSPPPAQVPFNWQSPLALPCRKVFRFCPSSAFTER